MPCPCCDPCAPCTGPTCCGEGFPRYVGFCCEDVWRMPTDGVCCAEVFYDAGGVCCGGVFYAEDGEEQGDCCGDVWYALPEGESLPNRDVLPFVPIVWETDQCPENAIYVRYGDYGECCGCIPDEVFDPRVGEGSPPTGGLVPTETVINDLCCDPCPGPHYLPFNAYGEYIGCNGVCCADDDCSRLPESLCAAGVHPTAPSASHYLWRQFAAEPCCGPTTCQTKCCVGNDLVEKAVFEVVGLVEGDNEWVFDIGGEQYSASSSESGVVTTDDIAAKLADRIVLASTSATSSGSTITVIGPDAGTATITPPGGSPTEPVSITTDITFAQCNAIGGLPRVGDRCPCQTGARCCEDATSSGLLLSFNKPPALIGTVRVTVTGYTTSPILVHGTLKGADATPTNRCRFTHTFVLCHGSFNIEPVPCGSTFHSLSVEVCWEEEQTPTESFNFSGCNGLTLTLGNCPYNCATTMIYAGAGHTSNSTIDLGGNAVIEANGTGALVLTSNMTLLPNQCMDKITLAGTSIAANKFTGNITGGGGTPPVLVTLEKDGIGTWHLSGQHQPVDVFNLLNGTVVFERDIEFNSAGPAGSGDGVINVGGTAASGEARFLLLNTMLDYYLVVTSGTGQRVLIGAAPNATSATVTGGAPFILNREITLVAPQGGTATFANGWYSDLAFNPATQSVRIGHGDFLGTVALSGVSATTGTVSVEFGVLELQEFAELSAGLVSIYGGAELMHNATTPFVGPLEFTGTAGTLSGTGTVDFTTTVSVSGTGHHISSDVAVTGNTTISGNGNLLISGVLSGTATITKTGTGTLTVTAGNTLTGTVTVSAGTLAIGNGGTSGSLAGDLVNNSAVIFNRSNNLTYAGVISGAGTILNEGTGTVSLSGNNTYTGTTTINSGTMKAESLTAFGTGDIVVNAGGTLDKNGFALANTITNNGGTVIP